MNGLNKGIRKVELAVKWDPSPPGDPATDLDIVAATFLAGDAYGKPAYVVHFDSRSPTARSTSTGTARTARASAGTRS